MKHLTEAERELLERLSGHVDRASLIGMGVYIHEVKTLLTTISELRGTVVEQSKVIDDDTDRIDQLREKLNWSEKLQADFSERESKLREKCEVERGANAILNARVDFLFARNEKAKAAVDEYDRISLLDGCPEEDHVDALRALDAIREALAGEGADE
jgi:hypothetical protein